MKLLCDAMTIVHADESKAEGIDITRIKAAVIKQIYRFFPVIVFIYTLWQKVPTTLQFLTVLCLRLNPEIPTLKQNANF